MIHDPHHTITAVTARVPSHLQLAFADAVVFDLDLAEVIQTHAPLSALRDPVLFSQARVDALGGYVVWIEDELEMAADNLRNLAVEQSGGIGHERMCHWMYRNGLTQQQAAEAIGISRRMLNYYLSGAKPIPKTVWLACVGFEAEQAKVL